MYVINGNKNSPNTLLILTGIHGNEYSPCILSNKICNNIELISELKRHYNEIIFLSNINKEGLVNNTREFINIDLNRIYQYDFSTFILLNLLLFWLILFKIIFVVKDEVP